jgi:hypothetical protein
LIDKGCVTLNSEVTVVSCVLSAIHAVSFMMQ